MVFANSGSLCGTASNSDEIKKFCSENNNCSGKAKTVASDKCIGPDPINHKCDDCVSGSWVAKKCCSCQQGEPGECGTGISATDTWRKCEFNKTENKYCLGTTQQCEKKDGAFTGMCKELGCNWAASVCTSCTGAG